MIYLENVKKNSHNWLSRSLYFFIYFFYIFFLLFLIYALKYKWIEYKLECHVIFYVRGEKFKVAYMKSLDDIEDDNWYRRQKTANNYWFGNFFIFPKKRILTKECIIWVHRKVSITEEYCYTLFEPLFLKNTFRSIFFFQIFSKRM